VRIQVHQSRRRYDRITVNLAAMIDVSFLLLFYFMAATMMEDRESRLSTGLKTESPSAAKAASDFQPQIIEVRPGETSPSYVLGSRTFADRAQLASALQGLPKDVGVLVRVFDGVDVGFAVAAVQVARDSGFEQVTYVPAK
jgi:biopolymer transport protein ExbD